MQKEVRDIPEFIEKIKSEIAGNPIAKKMGYPVRLEAKIDRLLKYFPSPDESLSHFFEEVLFNISISDTDLINVLKFVDKTEGEDRIGIENLFSIVWSDANPEAKRLGLSDDKGSRERLKRNLFEKIDTIRKAAKTNVINQRHLKKILQMQKALKLPMSDVIRIITISPRIIRGLRKSMRPLYAAIPPTLLASILIPAMISLPPSIAYILFVLIALSGTYLLSMHLKLAYGVLYYDKIRRYLNRIMEKRDEKTGIQKKMEEMGINFGEFGRENVYENNEKGIRIVIRDKKTLEGAVKFLTSSDEIGSCIALENFVSWSLPSLLSDDAVMLADVFCKNSRSVYVQRAQMWIIAAEEDNNPVIVVNSFEFNNEGAKNMNEIISEAVNVLQDKAIRCGFKKVYVGISTFGREYMDSHFNQGVSNGVVKKIHDPEAGYKYYFDVFRLKRSIDGWNIKKDYMYEKKRGMMKRAYSLIFGMVELMKGNRAKGRAFLETLRNTHNFWEVPL